MRSSLLSRFRGASLAPRLRALARGEAGVSAVEFGLISPVFIVLLFGALDVGHTLYVQSVLQGAVQKSGRDSTLQTAAGTSAVQRDAIDQAVKNQIQPLYKTATLTFKRQFYRTFTAAAAAQKETFTDTNSNGTCDNGEPYVNSNNNSGWDADGGDAVSGAGARDNVVYTVTMSYPRIFPLHRFINVPANVTAKATTVLTNQPYGDQAAYAAPTARTCPT